MGTIRKTWRSGVLAAGLLVAGCAQFPELDAVQTPGIETAAFPRLVPLETLLTGADPRATPEMIGALEGGVARLQARAARLRALRPNPTALEARVARLRQKAEALRAAE